MPEAHCAPTCAAMLHIALCQGAGVKKSPKLSCPGTLSLCLCALLCTSPPTIDDPAPLPPLVWSSLALCQWATPVCEAPTRLWHSQHSVTLTPLTGAACLGSFAKCYMLRCDHTGRGSLSTTPPKQAHRASNRLSTKMATMMTTKMTTKINEDDTSQTGA